MPLYENPIHTLVSLSGGVEELPSGRAATGTATKAAVIAGAFLAAVATCVLGQRQTNISSPAGQTSISRLFYSDPCNVLGCKS